MKLALEEAQRVGSVSPNPRVGAVLVKNNRILASGYHRGPGQDHGEIDALKKIKDPRGATLFVTLEPCCHEAKRTPPCVPVLINSGIKKIILGAQDPNPKVSGRGIKALRKSGIQVEVGVLKPECEALNPYYNHAMKTGQPYTYLKMASSLDGKVALANGKSKWITSAQARQHGHALRAQVDAILTGVGTVLKDNPRLSARGLQATGQPQRIILDPDLLIPLKAKVLAFKNQSLWIVTTTSSSKKKKAKALREKGALLVACPTLKSGAFSLKALQKKLFQFQIQSLMVEGGPFTWTEFICQKAFEEIWYYVAPKFLGGESRALLMDLGLKNLPKKPALHLLEWDKIGQDLWLRFSRESILTKNK